MKKTSKQIEPNENALTVDNLSVSFKTERGLLKAVDSVSFTIPKGSVLGIVGESGSGKTVLCRTLIRLLPESNLNIEGSIDLFGINVIELRKRQLRQLYKNVASIIFQDPLTALNPVMKVKHQIAESLKLHSGTSRSQRKQEVIDILELVGIPDPQIKANCYPHQLSGGQRQRVMIACAIASSPTLLIADEPTTALDTTIQLQILQLLKSLQKLNQMTLILVSHDLGVVNYICDYLAVMYAGKLVEFGKTSDILDHPYMPYTKALLDCMPSLSKSKSQKLQSIPNSMPDPFNLPLGCRFAPRCTYVQSRCVIESPKLISDSSEANIHEYACFFPIKPIVSKVALTSQTDSDNS